MNEVPEKLSPSTFSEENTFLGSDNVILLKHHCTMCYLQIRKELLDYLKDLLTQDALIGSTVNTRSKKSGSNFSKIKSIDAKSSNLLDFYPSTSTMHLYSNSRL
jgi:hypothetical protein